MVWPEQDSERSHFDRCIKLCCMFMYVKRLSQISVGEFLALRNYRLDTDNTRKGDVTSRMVV